MTQKIIFGMILGLTLGHRYHTRKDTLLHIWNNIVNGIWIFAHIFYAYGWQYQSHISVLSTQLQATIMLEQILRVWWYFLINEVKGIYLWFCRNNFCYYRSCGNVILKFHVTITYDALCLATQGPSYRVPVLTPVVQDSLSPEMDMFKLVQLELHCAGTHSSQTSSNLFIMKHLWSASRRLASYWNAFLLSM